MIYIKHRANKINDLKAVAPLWGVEIDLRSNVNQPGELHLHHDAWVRGDSFDSWLQEYSARKIAGPLILNTKEDGLEETIEGKLKQAKIQNYFFLDTAFPTLVKWVIKKKNPHFAVRFSSFESWETLKKFEGQARWVWVDCFEGEPVLVEDVRKLKSGFKVCLVSPELQGKTTADIARFLTLVPYVDAICTKDPHQWELGVRDDIKTVPPHP